MKPKEWLKANGHITEIKRGRLSLPHIALIEEAVRNGTIIDGYAVSATGPARTVEDKPKASVERTPLANVKTIADLPPETHPEDKWKAHMFVDGVKRPVGMRTVCNTCPNSLTYCRCSAPMVWVDHERQATVYFSPITK